MFRLLTLIFLSIYLCSLGQTDFNNYRTLRSQGDIPAEFTRTTKSKLDEDLLKKGDNMTTAEKEVFYTGTNYSIDEILHSGLVVYGDPISTYASEIADHLLRNDPELRKKLRFYTIKSNATNAFSTDQGIIFMTTGLIAQITSEAQLAYVLAHEIAHFKEKHVQETFSWTINNSKYSDRIDLLANHSKEKEFEADRGAIPIYHAAGYKLDGIFETFDVLMYSYLPFEEIEFPKTYFNSSQIFLPLNLFPKKKYEIKAEEDYDDSNSSHPNIKKRKDSVELIIGQYLDWGSDEFFLGKSRFDEVRDIARFESVRSDVLEANYGDGLYSVFLLENKYPNSSYLRRMKAQIWLNLIMYKSENKANQTIDNISDLEGESAALHYMLKKLSKEGMITLALRQGYDLQKSAPDDPELKAILNKMIDVLGETEFFKPDKYAKKTFEQAITDLKKQVADSTGGISKVDTLSAKSSSKYDKIKKEKNLDNVSTIDSTKFYLYALTDVLSDSTFMREFKTAREKSEAQERKKLEYKALTKTEQKKWDADHRAEFTPVDLSELIVVEPKVISYTGADGYNPVKSEEIESLYSEIISETSKELGIHTHSIDRRTLSEKETEGFNDRNVLISLLNQMSEDENVNVFPVDYSELNELKNKYKTSDVMFTLVEHSRKVNINWWLVAGSVVCYPTIPITLTMYIPMRILKANHTEMSFILLDLDNGSIQGVISSDFYEPVKKHNLGSHMYNILYQLNSKSL